MSDLVGNHDDRFSRDTAHIAVSIDQIRRFFGNNFATYPGLLFETGSTVVKEKYPQNFTVTSEKPLWEKNKCNKLMKISGTVL